MARVTSTKKTQIKVENPGLGLNKLISDTKIKDTEASDLLNIEFVESGCPSKRRGSIQVGDTVGTRVRGLGNLYLANGNKELLAMMGTTLRKLVGSNWNAISGVTFTNIDANFVQANNAVYIHNGTDNMAKYDGTTLNQPATGVKGKFGIYYSGKHIVGGNPSFPSHDNKIFRALIKLPVAGAKEGILCQTK